MGRIKEYIFFRDFPSLALPDERPAKIESQLNNGHGLTQHSSSLFVWDSGNWAPLFALAGLATRRKAGPGGPAAQTAQGSRPEPSKGHRERAAVDQGTGWHFQYLQSKKTKA